MRRNNLKKNLSRIDEVKQSKKDTEARWESLKCQLDKDIQIRKMIANGVENQSYTHHQAVEYFHRKTLWEKYRGAVVCGIVIAAGLWVGHNSYTFMVDNVIK